MTQARLVSEEIIPESRGKEAINQAPRLLNTMAIRRFVCVLSLLAIALQLQTAIAQSQSAMESDQMAEMFGGQQFGRGKDKKAAAIKADLPLIRCGTCEGIVKQSIAAVKQMRADATPIKKVGRR